MSLLYRLATLADLPPLVTLEEGTFNEDRLSARSFRHLIAAPSADLVVAEKEGELLGYALLLFRQGSGVARLYSLAVSARARGQGVGRGLLEEGERRSAARNCSRLRLEVRLDNPVAIALYERQGYRRFARTAGFYEDGSDAWRYEKTLGHREPDRSGA
ncbi:GNAT family N-acetyltransferase [Pseudomonas sp. NY15437]|uniref:GNAT family N-acetyltransferase n=1 Tax=Pseudomonas sp. NY15437 TaxID=3400360 RepID=UPI003A84E2DE